WQVAFACNLAVTAGGDAGTQVGTRCGENGLKATGLAVGLTGLLNLGLSILSVKLGSVTGVAVATVIAQSLLGLVLGWRTCRHLELPAANWALRSTFLPLSGVLAAGAIRYYLPGDSILRTCLLLGVFGALWLGILAVSGVSYQMIRAELNQLKAIAG